MLLTDIFNLVYAPNSTSWITLGFDVFQFMLMPIVGGVMMTSVTYNYDNEPKTFAYANIDKLKLYSSQMTLVKTMLYSFVGKTDFFGEDAIDYIPPLIGNWDGL